jgi:hypothetical protein
VHARRSRDQSEETNVRRPRDLTSLHTCGGEAGWGLITEVSPIELQGFYEGLVRQLRDRGVICLYAGPQTVAEMKRTLRDKDWAFITALGLRMIEAGDERGWLHIYDPETLTDLLRTQTCPPELAHARPALQLALEQDPRSAGALNAERKLWEELDRRRIRLLEHHPRPYVSAVRRELAGKELPLEEEHAVRIACATRHLPDNPLKVYGVEKYINEARAALIASGLIPESALTWLPDVGSYFRWLS